MAGTSRRLEGVRAVVTGAGSGIGRATVLRYLREGSRVAALDIDEAGLASLRAKARSEAADVRLVTIKTDVAAEDQVDAAINSTVGKWDGIDVVVANAGIQLQGQDGPVHDLPLDVWERTLRVNLTGVFLTCKHAARTMLGSGGSIICTGSPTGLFGMATGLDAYSASKGGVMALVRVMAVEYATRGIRVNAVIPGIMDTPLNAALTSDETAVEGYLQTVPMRRLGSAEDVAGIMVYLASADSSFATGGFFTVDGGLTAI